MRELAADARASQQVSANLGYESVAGFITMFKKALEKPPAKYLNSVAQNIDSAFVVRGPSGGFELHWQ
jgi:AraC-like DNA-binding protein